MTALTKQEFLSNKELKRKYVSVPELGKDKEVILQELGAQPRIDLLKKFGDEVEAATIEGPEALQLFVSLLAASLIEENGDLMCDTEADLNRLAGKLPDLLIRLGREALTLSGMSGEDLKETEKN